MTGVFVGLSALALLLQFVLFTNVVHGIAVELPNDGEVMMEEFVGRMFFVLAASAFVFLPLTFLVGILTTFRVAGPLYRIERFLVAVAEGGQEPDVRLRRKDRLEALADAANRATRPLRPRAPDRPLDADGDPGAAPSGRTAA